MNEQQLAAMRQALKRAFQLGQNYWSWADSEYSSHWKKADDAKAEFDKLVEDTTPPAAQPAPVQEPDNWKDRLIAQHEETILWQAKRIGELTDQAAQPQQEPSTLFESFQEFGEGWERLAWELCADENGEEACNDLIWEGGPIPEPWGERWLKYEDEAKRLIALVQKHTSPPSLSLAQRQRSVKPLTDEEIEFIRVDQEFTEWSISEAAFKYAARAIEAAHGIKGDT